MSSEPPPDLEERLRATAKALKLGHAETDETVRLFGGAAAARAAGCRSDAEIEAYHSQFLPDEPLDLLS